jgi:hypothetical protein
MTRWLSAGVLLLSLLLPISAQAAIARVSGVVASDHFDGASSGTCVYAANWSAGDLLVIAGATAHNTTAVTVTVADGLANSWTVIAGTDQTESAGAWAGYHANTFIAWFVATAPSTSAGERTVTVTPSAGTTYASYSCDAFSGAATSSTRDATSTTIGTTLGAPETLSDTHTTAVANDVIVGVYTDNSPNADPPATVGSGWTLLGKYAAGGATTNHFAEFKVVTTATAYTVDFGIDTGLAVKYQASAVSWKPLVAGGGASAAGRRRVQ